MGHFLIREKKQYYDIENIKIIEFIKKLAPKNIRLKAKTNKDSLGFCAQDV
jgi:hypothetical protein